MSKGGSTQKKISRLPAFSILLCFMVLTWNVCGAQSEASHGQSSSVVVAPQKIQSELVSIQSQHQVDDKIILTFTHPVTYKTFSLDDPARMVVDFPDTRYALSSSANLNLSELGVIDLRHGIQEGYNLRLVFDLQQSRSYSIKLNNSDKANAGKKFEVEIVFAHSNTPSAPLKISPTSSSPSPIVAKQFPVIKPSKATVQNEKPLVTSTVKHQENANVEPIPAGPRQKFIVVIDAGHGGKDPGATGPQGTHEKDVTLAIAKDLEALVNAQPNMKAVLTRSSDKYIGLRRRLMIARKAKGDIFIAIHADAYDDTSASGASVYALSLHGSSSEAALWLSQKENYSELDGIDLDALESGDLQVRSVLIDLSQTATISASLSLGKNLLSQLGKITDLHHACVEQAPFMVLKSPDIPSVLVETGFITNPNEESRLKTENYQQKLAKALLFGLKAYYEQHEEIETHCDHSRA